MPPADSHLMLLPTAARCREWCRHPSNCARSATAPQRTQFLRKCFIYGVCRNRTNCAPTAAQQAAGGQAAAAAAGGRRAGRDCSNRSSCDTAAAAVAADAPEAAATAARGISLSGSNRLSGAAAAKRAVRKGTRLLMQGGSAAYYCSVV